MDTFVAHMNVENFRQALAKERDEAKRQTLARLLADEEAKLASALHGADKESKATPAG